MIHVAVERSALVPKRTGIARCVTELVAALARIEEIEVVVDAALDLWRGAGVLRTHRASEALGLLARGWTTEYVRLGARLRRRGVDVYHATASRAPVRAPGIPLVVTVYDVAPFDLAEMQGAIRSRAVRAGIRRAVRASAAVVVPSETARSGLARWCPGAEAKSVVIPPGVSPSFRLVRRAPATEPTFVSVATVERRKNLPTLVDAFARVVRRHPRARLRLIGKPGNDAARVAERVSAHRLDAAVSVEGYRSDEDVRAAYATATAVVYPSLHEGFGLPILEAMAAGTPVVTSDRGAMRETAAEAALLVDPGQPEEIADAMLRLAADGGLREALRAAGRARAAEFTWEVAARRHAALYRAVAGARPGRGPA